MFVRINDKEMDELYEACDAIDSLVDMIEETMNKTPHDKLKGEVKPLFESLIKEVAKLKVFVEKI